ncbi:hypothetical protein SCLCIDRAFT_595305 [Scleroderma citrinum Foug A]|uniref:Uncharacterized protein n=1 Tax=Scleroderma citrinum Foug A TaxID=1036808 RepID=A0A0C3DW43_9AGAM|nr:hypothetical protein SCLCIDRAFT_595305 [Scleroderma citrinum Foug A]
MDSENGRYDCNFLLLSYDSMLSRCCYFSSRSPRWLVLLLSSSNMRHGVFLRIASIAHPGTSSVVDQHPAPTCIRGQTVLPVPRALRGSSENHHGYCPIECLPQLALCVSVGIVFSRCTALSFNLVALASIQYGCFFAPRTAWIPIGCGIWQGWGLLCRLGIAGIG